MIRLNLETKNKAQEILKEYLENNASEILANKINNGVKIQKDDKTLLNKKDLNGFMKFASDEARKQTESGASFACIESDAVFGWAMHYFEEDDRPQARLDRNLEGGMAVSIGRLRDDVIFDYRFISLSHNTLRGAAGGAVEMAELLCAEGYMN